MSKLYIFGIGGTGSRVIKSFTMLLAAGCQLNNTYDKVIPIIIDPDKSNGDLNRTKEILLLYQQIRDRIDEPDDFFQQELSTINNLLTGNPRFNDADFHFELENVNQEKFKEYIHLSSLKEKDTSIVDLLYSKKNLNADLNIGFKGNPNMGSVVLNQFTDSKAFKEFGNSFTQGDSIFIINSIFGGTGAAGYPLLLKQLRGGADLAQKEAIQKSTIGAITYLPYFKLAEGEIKSGTFIGKAKAALDYYNRTILKNNEINLQYLIGDTANTSTYENHVGKKEQMNAAHFLELSGALAIFDFAQSAPSIGVGETKVKEFGVEDYSSGLDMGQLNQSDREILNVPLHKYTLFASYLRSGLNRALGVARWTLKKTTLTKAYFNSPEYKNEIEKFNNRYLEWLEELAGNSPAFETKLQRTMSTKSLFKDMDVDNCMTINDVDPTDKKHTQLIKLFGKTTSRGALNTLGN